MYSQTECRPVQMLLEGFELTKRARRVMNFLFVLFVDAMRSSFSKNLSVSREMFFC